MYILSDFQDPEVIINMLDLRKPIFGSTATYGHFRRDGFA
jgi:S-adenosylmethionine synthetase